MELPVTFFQLTGAARIFSCKPKNFRFAESKRISLSSRNFLFQKLIHSPSSSESWINGVKRNKRKAAADRHRQAEIEIGFVY